MLKPLDSEDSENTEEIKPKAVLSEDEIFLSGPKQVEHTQSKEVDSIFLDKGIELSSLPDLEKLNSDSTKDSFSNLLLKSSTSSFKASKSSPVYSTTFNWSIVTSGSTNEKLKFTRLSSNNLSRFKGLKLLNELGYDTIKLLPIDQVFDTLLFLELPKQIFFVLIIKF